MTGLLEAGKRISIGPGYYEFGSDPDKNDGGVLLHMLSDRSVRQFLNRMAGQLPNVEVTTTCPGSREVADTWRDAEVAAVAKPAGDLLRWSGDTVDDNVMRAPIIVNVGSTAFSKVDDERSSIYIEPARPAQAYSTGYERATFITPDGCHLIFRTRVGDYVTEGGTFQLRKIDGLGVSTGISGNTAWWNVPKGWRIHNFLAQNPQPNTVKLGTWGDCDLDEWQYDFRKTNSWPDEQSAGVSKEMTNRAFRISGSAVTYDQTFDVRFGHREDPDDPSTRTWEMWVHKQVLEATPGAPATYSLAGDGYLYYPAGGFTGCAPANFATTSPLPTELYGGRVTVEIIHGRILPPGC